MEWNKMRVKAYGKINLTLDVLGRREDGYHLLDSVMQTVSIWDELDIRRSLQPGVRLQCDREDLPTDSTNTAVRAAESFLENQGLQNEGVALFLRKRIPSRAGMGGGSADAAAVLRGLDKLFETHLLPKKLMELGAKVGADVPFCITGGTARCTGVGENVEPAPPMPDCWLAICRPPAGVSTPQAYALLDQYPLSAARATPLMLEALAAADLRRIAGSIANQFDEAIRLAPVQTIKRTMLDAGALGSMMTGSGSCVYGIFETEELARAAVTPLKDMGQVFLAQPCPGV